MCCPCAWSPSRTVQEKMSRARSSASTSVLHGQTPPKKQKRTCPEGVEGIETMQHLAEIAVDAEALRSFLEHWEFIEKNAVC
jgi:hypothetical protein